jgi:hypothetical protein
MALPTFSLPTATPAFQALPTLSFNSTPAMPISSSAASPMPWPTIPTYTPLAFTDPSIPLSERIVYYYFVTRVEDPLPEGTVFIAGHPLAPAYTDETYTSDTAADLRTALEIVLHDGRNIWRGSDLEIVEVIFGNGHANIVLQGEFFAAGGGPLWTAGRQILMTVFANLSVQTASISVNGGAVTNMGISNSREALPADYVYTRPGIEPSMNESAYISRTPTSVPALRPSPTPLVFTDPTIPLSERIVYYYFVTPAENPGPEGRVGGLAPTYADETYTSDTAADLKTALEIILKDGRNYWQGNELEIADATFSNGHADVALQGKYFAMGDGVRCIASRQILFTVFANPAVQTATVTLNGGLIGNLCFFGPPNTDDYLNDAVYTRAEIEKFMGENAYVSP